jgi:hypothetical protein
MNSMESVKQVLLVSGAGWVLHTLHTEPFRRHDLRLPTSGTTAWKSNLARRVR